MRGEDGKDYEVGYGKPPIATRFKKGQCPNPLGRGRKKKSPPEFNPGKVLQDIDNEEMVITIDGKRMSMRKAEIKFRQLFAEVLGRGDLTVARLIAKMAVRYFGPEAEGPSETRFLVVVDGKVRRPSKAKRIANQAPQQVAAGVLFRKVAKDLVPMETGGKRRKISYWEAYCRKIHAMALNNVISAARLHEQLREWFPGDLLPGDPIYFVMRPEDENL